MRKLRHSRHEILAGIRRKVYSYDVLTVFLNFFFFFFKISLKKLPLLTFLNNIGETLNNVINGDYFITDREKIIISSIIILSIVERRNHYYA